jgi:hypothetical protein
MAPRPAETRNLTADRPPGAPRKSKIVESTATRLMTEAMIGLFA